MGFVSGCLGWSPLVADMLSSQAVVPKEAAIPSAAATALFAKWLNFELLTTFFFSIFIFSPDYKKFN